MKGEGKEIGTQTEPLLEERIAAPKHFEGKSVQTESEASVPILPVPL